MNFEYISTMHHAGPGDKDGPGTTTTTVRNPTLDRHPRRRHSPTLAIASVGFFMCVYISL